MRPTTGALSLSKGKGVSRTRTRLTARPEPVEGQVVGYADLPNGALSLSKGSCPQIADDLGRTVGRHPPWDMAFTYMLRCSDGSLYVGSTRSLETRVQDHAIGAVAGHTASHLPVTLVWFHETERVSDAYWLEHQIKGWRREKKLALIEGRFDDLPALARTAH